MSEKNIKRIIFIANTRLKQTNILQSMLLALQEMGHYIREIDIQRHPGITNNPHGYQGGNGPVEIKYPVVKPVIDNFRPDIIIFAGGGLTFSEEISHMLKKKGIFLLGITLSDPDVMPTARNYIGRFSHHTTNSRLAMKKYQDLGFTSTSYMPFGIDSRFFVPARKRPEYSSDITLIGHFRENRLPLAKELYNRHDTKIYGRNWPLPGVKSVSYPEIKRVFHSTKIIIDFPRTGSGFNNVKIRLFEAAATGNLIITEKLDIIEEFFQYGQEIIGYSNRKELHQKINYYLRNKDKRKEIEQNARLRCAEEHLWQYRFASLFDRLKYK